MKHRSLFLFGCIHSNRLLSVILMLFKETDKRKALSDLKITLWISYKKKKTTITLDSGALLALNYVILV